MRFFLLLLSLAVAPAWGATPVVVETFTSQYCPNCPAAETTLNSRAAGRSDFMVLLEHVDYWDNPASNHVDPLGNPDFTQRQYDYSNRLGRRPGEVFTPQPIFDGARLAAPPLWLGFDGVLNQALAANVKAELKLKPRTDGGLDVSIPPGTPLQNAALTVLSIEKSRERPNLWQARGVSMVDAKGVATAIDRARVPAGGSHLLVLLQEPGGPVVGMGMVGR